MCAPRRRALSSSSRTRTAAPSPRTRPLRVRSKGRQALSGVSLRGVVAWMASKQAEVIGEIGASVAPAIIMSAVPSRMSSTAWPSESRPEVQPVETTAAGPSAPAAQADFGGHRAGHEVPVQLGDGVLVVDEPLAAAVADDARTRAPGWWCSRPRCPGRCRSGQGRGPRRPGRCRRAPHGWRPPRTGRPGRGVGPPAGRARQPVGRSRTRRRPGSGTGRGRRRRWCGLRYGPR